MIAVASRRENLALVRAWSHAVFRDGELLGRAHPVDNGWLAQLANCQTIGVFSTELGAVRAVLTARRP